MRDRQGVGGDCSHLKAGAGKENLLPGWFTVGRKPWLHRLFEVLMTWQLTLPRAHYLGKDRKDVVVMSQKACTDSPRMPGH